MVIKSGSIRFRLARNFTAAFGLTLILTSWVSFLIFARAHQESFDSSLYNHAIDVASAIDTSYFGAIQIRNFPATELEKREPFPVRGSFMQLRDARGQVLAATANLSPAFQLPLGPSERDQLMNDGVGYRTFPSTLLRLAPGTDFRMISYVLRKPSLAPLILQIAVPMTLVRENQRDFLRLLSVLVPLGIVFSAALALWASRSAFYPVVAMTQQAARIQLTNLRDRIEVGETDPELRELGRTFNQLLSRIEASIAAQDRFVADASHQLKTPLAVIQGELELLRERIGPTHAEGEALGTVAREVAQLIRLTENLLLLARMDAGLENLSLGRVRLDELAAETVRRLSQLAHRAELVLKLELRPDPGAREIAQIDFECAGDYYLLRCLFENLIENAIKYSAGQGAVVKVILSETAERYRLEVADEGPGFSEAELSGILQSFHRDPHKALRASGAGLGLIIVKRIAELHQGSLDLASAVPHGALARVELLKKT